MQNGFGAEFAHKRGIDEYSDAFGRFLQEGKILKIYKDNHPTTQQSLQRIRQEIYRQFIVKILHDLRQESVYADAQLLNGTQGLSANIVSRLLGKPIYVAIPQTQAHERKEDPKSSSRYRRPWTRSCGQDGQPPIIMSRFLE